MAGASVYVPVEPRQRLVFAKKLREHNLLRKEDLIFGDFNCVSDTNLDTKYKDDMGSYDSQNAGGKQFDALMADSGLSDIFRMRHGKARQYTRQEATVLTRIDRAYAQKYDSPWRFVGFQHSFSAMHGAHSSSDHAAVIVEIETAKSRKATEHEERIDPHAGVRRSCGTKGGARSVEE